MSLHQPAATRRPSMEERRSNGESLVAGADLGSTLRALVHLQRQAGNAAVGSMMESGSPFASIVVPASYSLATSIPRAPLLSREAQRDVGQGTAGGGDAAPIEEDMELPVYESSYPAEGDADRTISSNLTYSPSVTVLPDEPKKKDEFGFTWGNHVRTAPGGKIHPTPTTYEVTQTYENPITIKVFADKGPRDQLNIESDQDADITKTNYPKVASDLTPDGGGVPPRTKFWARDLTLIHEHFHATDGQKFCKDELASISKSLNGKTAASMDDVKALLGPIVDQLIKAREAGMVGGEERAYKAGAAAYKDRADKVKSTGKAGKYASLEPSEGGAEPTEVTTNEGGPNAETSEVA
ncbi:MAG: hypothetical protein DLM67_00505 [Candidatus Nephthysia bennettiae]|uniref:Uncharacterized protein n=1 Tax=Candidatus Nephthysia bennettiae TaxID=3127016 RepID=A0A934K0D1_9BACT|nr:hypothetical protein [Candidatus Dormibacteraeota bacterium]PZS00804.1 MAG: hypothetical protein DLM67_00505 [Candidatus Dormibacteraeota bacterium]